MIEDILFDNLDSLDDIDTSDIDEHFDSSDDYSDFYDTVAIDDCLQLEDFDDYDGISSNNNPFSEDNCVEDNSIHTHHEHTSAISFGAGGHCLDCKCDRFRGTYGDVCTNCLHGYHRHV
ncbi:MAG: hypothetical protein ACI4TK_02090 [Agathobacter sp.]